MLELYRTALRLRKSIVGGASDFESDVPLRWLDTCESVIAFARSARALQDSRSSKDEDIARNGRNTKTNGRSFACIVNLSDAPVRLPPHEGLLLASAPLEEGMLPRDAAAWLRV